MNFNEKLENTLKQNDKFCDTEGNLLKQKVKSLALSFDEELIVALLNDTDSKEHFFKQVGEATIFDYRKLIDFIDDKNFLLDSYTKFSNKIGLTISDKHIKQIGDVVLTFPFKDCTLEGGQSQEKDNRKEIFFNETLAKDEISRLLDKKVISNATKYYYENNEVKETTSFTFTRDKEINIERDLDEDTITDNLIIKGNNLLALHSLKSNFAGKVKLIYIDPPYNTGSDSFKYNDSFNHSTWLTFMKNRLEVAKELLTEDGVIFVQCDDNEQAYLKVLMDDIFHIDNFINLITVKTKIGGVSGSSEGKSLKDSTEFINIFVKNKDEVYFNPIFKSTPLYDYITAYKEEGKSWKYTSVITKLEGKKQIKKTDDYTLYAYEVFESKSIKEFSKENGMSEEDVYMQFNDKIFRTTNAQSSVRQTVINETEKFNEPILSIEYIPKKGKNKGLKTEILYKDTQRNMLMFLSDMVIEIDGVKNYKEKLNTLWDDIEYNNLSKEGGVDFPNGKKPEKLLKRVIELTTSSKDIVLDFHLGSGATCGVAHKMDRQYIGIEQMEYIKEITIPRLQNTINNDQSGISQNVDWQGGGEFIYFELDKYNQKFIDDLSVATDKNILDIYNDICEKGFLNYDVELKKIEEHFEEFKAFSLEDKKEFLISMLNKNMLYKNLTEIDDTAFKIDDKVKALNKDFYNTDEV